MTIVELEKDCWLADWKGDPGRTCSIEHAKLFHSQKSAKAALKKARTFRPFESANILEV